MPFTKTKPAPRRATSVANWAWQRPRWMCGRKSRPIFWVSKLRRLRQLEEENTRLKRLVADPSLDKHMLAEALRKKV
jgi:hypothetical protein